MSAIRTNLRNLCEPLGGSEGLIETVGFKKTTEYVMKNKRERPFPPSSPVDLTNKDKYIPGGPKSSTPVLINLTFMSHKFLVKNG